MVALARDAADHNRRFAVRRDARNPSGIATLRDIKRAAVKRRARPRLVAAFRDRLLFSVRLDANQPARGVALAVSVAGLNDVRPVRIVENDRGWERETSRHRFNAVAGWERDIGGVNSARADEHCLGAAAGFVFFFDYANEFSAAAENK